MITVNLRPGLKRKTASSPLKAVRARLTAVGARVKDPLLVSAAAAWVVVGAVVVVGWMGAQHSLSALEPRLEQARNENTRFQTYLKAKRKQELIRDSLLAQIGTIRSVDGDRYVWPHILDEVARALPAYTWLTSVALAPSTPATAAAAAPAPAKGAAGKAAADTAADTTSGTVDFRIEGRTVDIQAYTRFLRQLEASPWIQNVTPVSAQTVVEKERPVTAFVIQASYRRADSAYIKTVPLSQSVR